MSYVIRIERSPIGAKTRFFRAIVFSQNHNGRTIDGIFGAEDHMALADTIGHAIKIDTLWYDKDWSTHPSMSIDGVTLTPAALISYHSITVGEASWKS